MELMSQFLMELREDFHSFLDLLSCFILIPSGKSTASVIHKWKSVRDIGDTFNMVPSSREKIDFLLETILTKPNKFCSVLCSAFMKRWFFENKKLRNFGADVELHAPGVGIFLGVRVVANFKKLEKATPDSFLCRWRVQKMQMLNHIEINYRNINVNF